MLGRSRVDRADAAYAEEVIFQFDAFELDTATLELRAGGQLRPVEPQVFALLALLIENSERVVSKDEIVEKVWGGRVVSEAAVASRIKSARQALGDDGKQQRFIRTLHRQGLRFVAEAIVGRSAGPALACGAPESADPQLRPSIAVLPFRLLGSAGRLTAIADALPHDLIVSLSRLRWLLVTARGSSFRLRGLDADPNEVGRLLDVHYVLTGLVQIDRMRLEVTVELIDTRDSAVIWAERFVGSTDDVHQVREDIVARVLVALDIRIPAHEALLARLKASENLDAWSAYHLGLRHMYRFNRGDNGKAEALFRRSLEQDPGFARAHAGLSFVHFQSAFMGYQGDRSGAIGSARKCAARGLELDPLDPFVNFTMGRSYWLDADLGSSLTWLERSTSLSPHFAQGLYARAWTESLAGRPVEGRRHVDLAMRLSPLDPLYYAMLATRAFSHMVEGEDREAAYWAERAARSNGAHELIALIAAAAHAINGDDGAARAWVADARSRHPTLTRNDFFRAFPMQPTAPRGRVSNALKQLGL